MSPPPCPGSIPRLRPPSPRRRTYSSAWRRWTPREGSPPWAGPWSRCRCIPAWPIWWSRGTIWALGSWQRNWRLSFPSAMAWAADAGCDIASRLAATRGPARARIQAVGQTDPADPVDQDRYDEHQRGRIGCAGLARTALRRSRGGDAALPDVGRRRGHSSRA